jgi:hypothetical protein
MVVLPLNAYTGQTLNQSGDGAVVIRTLRAATLV